MKAYLLDEALVQETTNYINQFMITRKLNFQEAIRDLLQSHKNMRETMREKEDTRNWTIGRFLRYRLAVWWAIKKPIRWYAGKHGED